MPGTPRAASGCLALLILPLLSSCSSGTPPQSSPSFSFRPANPVSVTEHLDTAKASSATLDAGGGTVSATGSDGVTFTLVVPPNALLVSQQITLTPVASIAGLPFQGGLSAAVHLEPDGLTLFKPATLTIAHNKPAPPPYAQIGFEYQGSGTGLHFYPTQQASGLEFTLMHFTSPGVGGVSKQDVNAQLGHAPADNLAQIEQYIAALNETQRQLVILDNGQALSTEALMALYAAALAAEERLVLNPEIAAATQQGAPYEVVATALQHLNEWKLESDSFDIPQPDYDALLARISEVLPALFKNQVNACFTNDDIRAALRAFELLRMAQVVGADVALPLDPILRCLHFEVDFETQLNGVRPPGGTTADMHLKASSVPVGMASSNDGGAVPLSYLSYKQTNPLLASPADSCTWTTISAKGIDPFQVVGLQGLALDYQEGSKWLAITDFSLLLDPGTATETVSMECRPFGHPTGSFVQGPFHDYNTFWGFLHAAQLAPPCPKNPPKPSCHEPTYAISGWQLGGGRLFARKTFQESAQDGALGLSVDETTTLDLFHTPQGGPVS
jgi:hypothetical protein